MENNQRMLDKITLDFVQDPINEGSEMNPVEITATYRVAKIVLTNELKNEPTPDQIIAFSIVASVNSLANMLKGRNSKRTRTKKTK